MYHTTVYRLAQQHYTSNTADIRKRWYYWAVHWHL